MQRIAVLTLAASAASVVSVATADTVFSYGTLESTYTQNFDSLASTGTSTTWSNASTTPTLAGWNAYQAGTSGIAGTRNATQANITAMQVGTGSGTGGGIYSFGTGGTPPSTERALGALNSNAVGDVGFTFAVKNTVGYALTSFTFSWVLEQWRDGGNNPAAAQGLVVDYKVTSVTSTTSLSEGLNYLTDVAYTTGFTTLATVNSPTFTTTGGALDGNASANRVLRTDTVSNINWANNTVLVIRFWDDNHTGNDHGLAIDDVTFSAVPAPGAVALVGLAGFVGLGRRRK